MKAELLASIIITTYNRVDALKETLCALADQTIPPSQYEILVVDNGSIDETWAFLSQYSPSCGFRYFKLEANQGIAAGRNTAIRQATGKYLIMVSDDLIVPPAFIATHLETQERFPNCWVVGSFQQLDSLILTPFGRYLDSREKYYESLSKVKQVDTDIWELGGPTARNLSVRRADLEKIGLFDEQFRNSCEDQDLAHRARELGVRFLYNTNITCLHNDQAGDLLRQCRFQERGAHDTVLFCFKYPIHRSAPIAQVNGYLDWNDGADLLIKKLGKIVLSTEPLIRLFERSISIAEKLGIPETQLWRMYRMLIGLYIFRGWRRGLATLRAREGNAALIELNREDGLQQA